jgi:uncharacterized membrane protein
VEQLKVMLEAVYIFTGSLLCIFAAITFFDRSHAHRLGTSLFWLLFGLTFIFGSIIPHWLTGVLVLVMVALDAFGEVGRSDTSSLLTRSRPVKHIILPVLAIPVVTFLSAAAFRLAGLDPNRGALVGLGLGGLVAMIICLAVTRGTVRELMSEGRRLNEAMGSVNILPQLLASLGVIFTAAGVGDLVAFAITRLIPGNSLFLLVLASCFGMAALTIIMGNSFAAFPVIATGVLAPLILKPFGVNPAMAAILTLTAGSSGTLMTPMAANFNIVPAALLEMRDQYGVIKRQLPYALTIWSLHVVLMWLMIRLF